MFGCVSDLKFTQLPTYEDVIKAVLFRKKHLKLQTNKDPSVKEICKNLAVNISSIYNEALIPAVSVKQISDRIFCYHTKYQGLMKSYKAHCNEENYSEKSIHSLINPRSCLIFHHVSVLTFICAPVLKTKKYLV